MSLNIAESYTIRSKRTCLRILHKNDIPYIFEALHSEGFMDGMTVEPPTLQELETSLSKDSEQIEQWQQGNAYTFSAEHLENHDFIGRVGIRSSEQSGVWLIHYYIHSNYQNQGYATELATKILKFGFQTLGAKSIEAFHAVPNAASKRVLEKVGMEFVERIENSFQKNGQWIDDNRFRILNSEWVKSILCRTE